MNKKVMGLSEFRNKFASFGRLLKEYGDDLEMHKNKIASLTNPHVVAEYMILHKKYNGLKETYEYLETVQITSD